MALLDPENTKTDNIHKPSHSRECSQWKRDLGKEEYCDLFMIDVVPILPSAFKLHRVLHVVKHSLQLTTVLFDIDANHT